MKKRLFGLACLLMATLTGLAQTGWQKVGDSMDANFVHGINVKDGLADNYVKDVLRDSYGFMWIATSNGLDRYDGYQFKRYTLTQLGNYDNNIINIKEDGGGTIWIQTQHHFYTYNRELDRVTNECLHYLKKLGIDDSVRVLTTDDSKNLWAASETTFYHYDFTTRQLHSFDYRNTRDIICITAREGKAYALARSGDFYRVDIRSNRFRHEGSLQLSASLWHQICLDSRGVLWFYTTHSAADGLYRYDTVDKRWLDSGSLNILNHVILTCLVDDEQGHVWIGTENEGICIYDCQEESVRMIRRREEALYPLPSNHISCFYHDPDNVMWIGSSKRGIACYDLSPQLFSITRMRGSEDVSCIVEDSQGNLWLGYDGDGIVKIDHDGRQTLYNKNNGLLKSNLVTCSLIDHSRQLWIGTYGGGVMRFDGQRFVDYQASAAPAQRAVYIKCMTEDEQGNLWVGTLDNGLCCRRQNGTEEWLSMDNSVLHTPTVTSLHSDGMGHLYVGTSTGFHVYDTATRHFCPETRSIGQLAGENVTSLYKDSRGLIWIGTLTGLRIYDEEHDRLDSLSAADGLSNPYIRAIIEDGNHKIWVSTDNGLTCIKVRKEGQGAPTFICTPFYGDDGLENATFNHDVACITRSGECIIGCTLGLLYINKEIPVSNYPPAHIMFTNLFVDNWLIAPGDESDILTQNFQLANEIELSHDENNFAVDVSAMNYMSRHKMHYQYRLSGNDEQWITLLGNRITFNALAPGSYLLEVRASDLGGWNSESSKLKIRILPPFWLSIPAFVLYLLLALAALLFYLKRLKQKHKKTLAVQALELELEQQHRMEENKMRFFTNISHDLKTPLSLIITPLEGLLSGNLDQKLRTELDMIWRNARLLKDGVSQLLDLRRLDVGTEELHLSHGDFIDFLRKVIDGFKYFSENRGIPMNLRINADKLEMDFDQNKMRRVVMNLLSNAFKYNAPKGSVTITVDSRQQDDRQVMRLEIADTGIGIKDENKELIFERFYQEETDGEYIGTGIGLHIVKEYVLMHHGEITVEDNHPQGSIFVVTIPMDHSQVAALATETSEQLVKPELTEQTANNDGGQTTILIVEDNLDFRLFLERCLNDRYHVLVASNGAEAIKVLDKHSVNIVISDIMMPQMNGLELCHRIKNNVAYSHIPVILLTAKSTEDNIISGLKDGADEYITKPFNLNILKLRIQKILEWTRNNHQNFSKTMEIAPSEITVSSIDEQLITKAIKVVEEHIADIDFTVEDLGSAVGMTRGHLYKKLMAITGKSPIEFIRILRIKRGRSLLEQGRSNISEVAYAVGFSPKQFSKYFKEEYGCLPSQFIKGD